MSPFGLDAFEMARVLATDDLIDKAAIGAEILEVCSASQQQGVLDSALEMAMGAFDRAVLMGDTAIVASGLHSIVSAQQVVTRGEILASGPIQIAERGRQTVAAMLARCTAERPECILQPFGQSHIALASEDDMGVFKAGVNQPEVVEPMIQGLSCNANAHVPHLGKIRQAHLTRLMNLAEHDFLLGPVQRTP